MLDYPNEPIMEGSDDEFSDLWVVEESEDEDEDKDFHSTRPSHNTSSPPGETAVSPPPVFTAVTLSNTIQTEAFFLAPQPDPSGPFSQPDPSGPFPQPDLSGPFPQLYLSGLTPQPDPSGPTPPGPSPQPRNSLPLYTRLPLTPSPHLLVQPSPFQLVYWKSWSSSHLTYWRSLIRATSMQSW